MSKPKNTSLIQLVKSLPHKPGVYQMISERGQVLYVGKAKDLQKRVSSYFRTSGQSARIERLVQQIASIETVITASENEALLLENNLIKQLKPRYNILFRDDKSYPYLYLSAHAYPRLSFYRGARLKKGRMFGPYPSTVSVRQTLNLLQKIFKLRQCDDVFFSHRTRPCLQYQIKRCTAPCVKFISEEAYAQDVQDATLFLEGKDRTLMQMLQQRMEEAANGLQYEDAAKFRDQISNLNQIQQQQMIYTGSVDSDIIALKHLSTQAAICVLMIRQHRLLGQKIFYFSLSMETPIEEILSSFLSQYYLNPEIKKEIPKRIFVNHDVLDRDWLIASFRELFQQTVSISKPKQGDPKRWMNMALENVNQALVARAADHAHIHEQWQHLQKSLGLPTLPQRMECFDVSHTMGVETVASCVAFDQHGPAKTGYRRYLIKGITPGDDYAGLKQALERHYQQLKRRESPMPDVIVIDGGKGQLHRALDVLSELQLVDATVLSIAKGPDRKPGLETIYLAVPQGEIKTVHLNESSFHLIQHIRDEAHRFAITGHRQRRGQRQQQSILNSIPGVGAARRRALLKQFGGIQEITGASVDELSKTPGIHRALAERIYKALH